MRSQKFILPIMLGIIFTTNSYAFAAESTDESEIGFISIREDVRSGKQIPKTTHSPQNQNTQTSKPIDSKNSTKLPSGVTSESNTGKQDVETARRIQYAMERGDYNEMQRLIMESSLDQGSVGLSNTTEQGSVGASNTPKQGFSQEPVPVQEALNNIGFLNLASRAKDPNKPEINKPSAEAEKILLKLRKIATHQQENEFDECLSEMKSLSEQYPESAIFRKWLGIYYNANGLNQESNDEFGHLLYMFPLDKNLWDDVAIQYYFADNYRRLGDFKNAEITINTVLNKVKNKEIVDKVSVTTFRNMFLKRPDLVRMLFNYQLLLLDEAKTKSIDKEKLDKVWSSIPKDDYKLLNNYYGFNLSTLEFLYGRFYNRKDILKNYVEHEGKTTNKEISKQVMEAKTIIANKY